MKQHLRLSMHLPSGSHTCSKQTTHIYRITQGEGGELHSPHFHGLLNCLVLFFYQDFFLYWLSQKIGPLSKNILGQQGPIYSQLLGGKPVSLTCVPHYFHSLPYSSLVTWFQ